MQHSADATGHSSPEDILRRDTSFRTHAKEQLTDLVDDLRQRIEADASNYMEEHLRVQQLQDALAQERQRASNVEDVASMRLQEASAMITRYGQ